MESIEELLKKSDVVSLHVPLLDSTRHLINEKRLLLMKPTSFLVNTSRGPVVNEAELVSSLKDGLIAGAGLDVFENENSVSEELRKLDNVILTPHIASATAEAREEMSRISAENIIAVLSGRLPINPAFIST